MIDSYYFGKIKIDGKTYISDVILYPDKVREGWYRKQGHLLQKEDLKDVIEYKPETLIVGTGRFGLMKISDEVKKFVESKNIELITEKTKDACKTYNELKDKKKVVAALHLTC